MRPVGPEPAETYWIRRALVVGAFLVLLIILLIVLFNLGGSPGQAAPAPAQTGIPVSAPPSATPSSPTPGAPTGTPTASSASSSASQSASPSESASPSQSASPSPSAADSPSPTGRTSKPPSKKASKTNKAGKSASNKPSNKPSTAAPVAACTADDLKPTVTSKRHDVKIGAKVGFDVSYTNSSNQPCTFSVSPDSYQLTIYSGSDRIWSTADCAKLVHTAKVTLKAGHAVAWSITWNGKRSQQGATCQNRPETPQAGYYHATSQLKDTPAKGYLLVLR